MHVSISASQAAIIALWVAIVEARALGYSTLMLRFTPLMTGLVVGIVMHNVPEAMVVTAAIQLIYMGLIAPGGTLPSEPAVAASIAVPVAVMANLDPSAAIAIAVPVGLLGSYLYSFRFLLNTFVLRLTDKYAEELNDRGLTLTIIVLPILVSLVLFFPAIFIALYKGTPLIAALIKTVTAGKLFHVLTVIGGGLPALGIALTLTVIGKRKFVVFFLLAYFMAVILKSLNVNTVTYAVLGGIMAYLYVMFTSKEADSQQI
ncbi:PTS sugar transporter subunit IIC [Thermoanaerobacterium saccharolyticum]|uniref:PTS sorbose-specific transporter subunit IIC n=2 Tax=Thermoanaerobacterium TaxID=28895 RepID=W9E7W2_9THEO|nr:MULTISPECIES: PTS sugar transporter subunit IIC [Thermoanaerobacterium]AFK87503.1 phosphotransferase system PTS sorbose-specific IIC subunit [Thermoanaerobacterium saccharolyticum JW/SL-YS485]ETO37753.1 PTS sorbose-specific transporter subunit IIC [Thermoanaerobacterium aotearoense SCUT27]HHV74643.1 PTS sugar transporter subunit IIC [Thermoanaerobacterium sp.]